MPHRDFPVLLVEDNKHDVKFVRRAWNLHQIPNSLFVVSNGQECLDFLRHEGEFSGVTSLLAPRPGIILMDIRMPVMDGIECLKHIRDDINICTIPVIMLTTSCEDQDLMQSYKLGCNSYIQKPVDFDKLGKALQTIHLFWTISEIPT